jgi:hypothetical protein
MPSVRAIERSRLAVSPHATLAVAAGVALTGACLVGTTANTVLFQSDLGVRPVETVRGWIYLYALAFVPTVQLA